MNLEAGDPVWLLLKWGDTEVFRTRAKIERERNRISVNHPRRYDVRCGVSVYQLISADRLRPRSAIEQLGDLVGDAGRT